MLTTFALTLKLVRVSTSFFAVVCSSSLMSVDSGTTGLDSSESGGNVYFGCERGFGFSGSSSSASR